jgi:hypothetical protein
MDDRELEKDIKRLNDYLNSLEQFDNSRISFRIIQNELTNVLKGKDIHFKYCKQRRNKNYVFPYIQNKYDYLGITWIINNLKDKYDIKKFEPEHIDSCSGNEYQSYKFEVKIKELNNE